MSYYGILVQENVVPEPFRANDEHLVFQTYNQLKIYILKDSYFNISVYVQEENTRAM